MDRVTIGGKKVEEEWAEGATKLIIGKRNEMKSVEKVEFIC